MTIPLRLGNRAEVHPAQAATFRGCLLPTTEPTQSRGRLELSTSELAFRIFAAFRAHAHINNVLTHISRAKWSEAEQSLNRILDLSTTSDGLSPLEENIIDLMVGERGITGKILKPYFLAVLHRIVEPNRAERLISHVTALYLELEWRVQRPTAAPLRSEPSEERDHVRGEPR